MIHPRHSALVIAAVLAGACYCCPFGWAGDKPRVIVLTDISNEPDDEESLVRFLVYANEFDVEGLEICRAGEEFRGVEADYRSHRQSR